jgi:hypothetical protein
MDDYWLNQPVNNMKRRITFSIVAAAMFGMIVALFVLLSARAADGLAAMPGPVIAAKPVAPAAPAADNPGVLDQKRRSALSMIETGDDDREIGGAGEVSRYQIMPSVWREYSNSQSYQNPEVSLEVARQHWLANYATFKQQARREPTDFDMYVLWNTRYGYYASRGFNPAKLSPAVRDRAQRFVNLVNCGDL